MDTEDLKVFVLFFPDYIWTVDCVCIVLGLPVFWRVLMCSCHNRVSGPSHERIVTVLDSLQFYIQMDCLNASIVTNILLFTSLIIGSSKVCLFRRRFLQAFG